MEETNLNKDLQAEVLMKMKDAVVFETVSLLQIIVSSKISKEDFLEGVKVIWNRSLSRVGCGAFLNLWLNEEDIRKIAADWDNKCIPFLNSLTHTNNGEGKSHD
jgi:hypothetical protein